MLQFLKSMNTIPPCKHKEGKNLDVTVLNKHTTYDYKCAIQFVLNVTILDALSSPTMYTSLIARCTFVH